MPAPGRHPLETLLACSTLALLTPYVALETRASWEHGCLNPFYLSDAIAMVLLFAGTVRSLRARPRWAPGSAVRGDGVVGGLNRRADEPR